MEAFPLPALDEQGFVATEAVSVAELTSALDEARAEADAIRAAAREEGLLMGRAEAEAEVQPAIEMLRSAASALEAERAQLAGAVEEAAVDLAVAIAEQVLGGALEVRPELVVDVVRGALRSVSDRERIVVHVHPDDLDVLREAMPVLAAELGGIGHVDVQAERRMVRGGAKIETAEAEVDATLTTKLELARAAVAASLRETQDDELDG